MANKKKNNVKKTNNNKKKQTSIKKTNNKKNTTKLDINRGYTADLDNQFELKKLIIIVGVMLVSLLICYFIVDFIIAKRSTKKTVVNSGETAVIQYDEIIVGQLLDRSYDDYYVLATTNSKLSDFQSYTSKLDGENNNPKLYTIDLDSAFNKKYLKDDSNLNVDDIKDIRFSKTTLLHIKDHKIDDSSDDLSDIIEILEDLASKVSSDSSNTQN